MSPFSSTKRSSSTDNSTKNANSKKNASKNASKDTTAVSKGNAEAEDASSAAANTPRPFSPVTNQTYHSKDTRAFEHARQRSKHAQDFAKKRAKKEEKAERKAAAAALSQAQAQSKVIASVKSSSVGHGHGHGRSWGGGMDLDVDEEEILMAPVERRATTTAAGTLVDSKVMSQWFVQPEVATTPLKQEGGGIRVNLADLIIVSERKPKRVGGGGAGGRGADDFEVVPHVKAVIALDDIDEFDMELDEPWEHIQADDEKARGGLGRRDGEELSYAKVAAGLATPTALD